MIINNKVLKVFADEDIVNGNAVIPNTVTSIGKFSFNFCASLLKHVDIPSSVTEIHYGAFWGSRLKSLVIPDSVVKIEKSAFRSCKKLEWVMLPAKITQLDSDVFSKTDALRHIFINSNNKSAINRIKKLLPKDLRSIVFALRDYKIFYSTQAIEQCNVLQAVEYYLCGITPAINSISDVLIEKVHENAKVHEPMDVAFMLVYLKLLGIRKNYHELKLDRRITDMASTMQKNLLFTYFRPIYRGDDGDTLRLMQNRVEQSHLDLWTGDMQKLVPTLDKDMAIKLLFVNYIKGLQEGGQKIIGKRLLEKFSHILSEGGDIQYVFALLQELRIIDPQNLDPLCKSTGMPLAVLKNVVSYLNQEDMLSIMQSGLSSSLPLPGEGIENSPHHANRPKRSS